MNTMRRRTKGLLFSASILLTAAGCDGLFDVSDPQRYTADDVDRALEAAANGVEGEFHSQIDNMTITAGLTSDEFQHTGTWAGYDDMDHGRFIFGTPQSDGQFNTFLSNRWFAEYTEERLNEVLGSEAATSPMMAQVRTVGALDDLYLGTYFCEAVAVPHGPAVSDVTMLQQAVEKFGRSLETARSAGTEGEKWELISLAGRARAHLLLGNYAEAAQDASAIPDGWSYNAIYTEARGDNSVVTLTTQGFNTAAGLREKWWDRVDVDAKALLDPWTDQPDPRMPVLYTGVFGVDGVTPHYSQWKYQKRGDDIPILTSGEMRLIEAEAAIRAGQIGEGLAIMNALRNAVGLDDLPDTDSQDQAIEYLLHERFAEMFMTGMRMVDLWRFDLVGELLARGDFAGSNNPRPVKFPMSDTEARDNTQISDAASDRCLPMTS